MVRLGGTFHLLPALIAPPRTQQPASEQLLIEPSVHFLEVSLGNNRRLRRLHGWWALQGFREIRERYVPFVREPWLR